MRNEDSMSNVIRSENVCFIKIVKKTNGSTKMHFCVVINKEEINTVFLKLRK